MTAQRPLFFDPYRRNRSTGSFILIDPITNETLGAGMIASAREERHHGPVTRSERRARIGHAGFVVSLVGGTLDSARALERHLFDLGYLVHVVTKPAHLGQALDTVAQAGLGAILYGSEADSVAARAIQIAAAEFADDFTLVRKVATILAERNPEGPQLTEGAGI